MKTSLHAIRAGISFAAALSLGVAAASSAWAQTACPTAPLTPQPSPSPTAQFSQGNERLLVVGSENAPSNNMASLGVRQGETVYVVVTPRPAPVPAGSPTPCPTPTWDPQFRDLVQTSPKPTLVTVWALPAVFDSTTFYFTDMGGNGRTPITVSPTVPAGVPAAITPPAIPSGMKGGYFLSTIPSGNSQSQPFRFTSRLNGVVHARIQAEIVGSVASQVASFSRATRMLPLLRFRTASRTTMAGACSQAVTVELTDGNGNLVDAVPALPPNAAQTALISLAAAPADVFLDSGCIYPTQDMTITNPVPAPPSGGRPPSAISTNSITFHYRGTQSQTFPITASYRDNGGPVVFQMSQDTTITPRPAIAMELKGPASVNQAECSAAFKVRLMDSLGNEASTSSSKVFTLSGSGLQFYRDSECLSAGDTLSLPSGASQSTFYVRGSVADQVKVTVADRAALGTAIQSASLEFYVIGQGRIRSTPDRGLARQQAIRIYDRLVGVPIALDDPNLRKMEDLIMEGRILEAAHIATDQDGFYNITIRNLATPLSNRLFNALEPLNDFVTTWIGLVRDERDARELLTGNTIYVDKSLATSDDQQCANNTVYRNNSHFEQLSSNFVNLRKNLVPVRQCAYNTTNFGVTNPVLLNDAAGLITTRTWGKEHLFMGTNRRGIEFAMKVFLCKDMNQLSDSSAPDYHIRRDVDRAPGGDPKVFQASCRACHGGMDGLAGSYAFFDAYFDPNNAGTRNTDFRLFYVNKGGGYGEASVMPKNNINSNVFPPGWVVGDDAWINFFNQGRNAALGWSSKHAAKGNGIAELGRTLANTQAFPSCMAERVFKEVCKREADSTEADYLSDLASDFQASGYNMRRLFEKAAVLPVCLGRGE